jgi:hypothetical protein
MRIPEDPMDRAQRAEARKAVRIPEASVFWHPEVMPDFSKHCNCETPCATRTFAEAALNFTHTFRKRAEITKDAANMKTLAIPRRTVP